MVERKVAQMVVVMAEKLDALTATVMAGEKEDELVG